MASTKIGFIGLGLIGGSVAKAIRKYYPDYNIIAFDKNRETLALAVQDGIIQTACSSIDKNFRECSYIFLCAPVAYNTAYLSQLKDIMSPDCILTDVGSVKTSIHEEITALDMEENFIGGHPMAGSEKTGPVHAYADLFRGALCLITPTSVTNSRALMAIEDFWRKIGCLTERLSPEEHDALVCRASHLPHIIAATLVYHALGHKPRKLGLLPRICASGFRDTTRVASGSPDMWRDIVLSNRDRIAEELEDYQSTLNRIKKILQEGSAEEIYRFFELARTLRNNWLDSKQK